MKIIRKYDEQTVDCIAKASGARSVKDATTYLRVPCYRGGERFLCEIIDDVAFFAGMMGKTHFRLYEMAVTASEQKKGYGSAMITRMKALCKQNGANKITLRTAKDEKAARFYMKHGGKITGENGNDWEMEIPV